MVLSQGEVFLLKDCFLFPAQELVSLVVEGSEVTLISELSYVSFIGPF